MLKTSGCHIWSVVAHGHLEQVRIEEVLGHQTPPAVAVAQGMGLLQRLAESAA